MIHPQNGGGSLWELETFKTTHEIPKFYPTIREFTSMAAKRTASVVVKLNKNQLIVSNLSNQKHLDFFNDIEFITRNNIYKRSY